MTLVTHVVSDFADGLLIIISKDLF